MGEIDVPARAYWGASTERARRNFPLGGGPIPRALIHALGAIKAAAAREHQQLALLEPEVGEAIARAADEVAAGTFDAEFVVDVFQTGSGTSSNMNANEVIANRALELLGEPRGGRRVHPNDHVNLGQSSNDVFPSAVQLALSLIAHDRLLPTLRALADRLHDLADRNFDVVKTGRTHLMDAMPIRFGQQLRGHAQQVERAAARIGQTLDGLGELPLGGTAVGTGVNAAAGAAAAICRRLARESGVASLRETSAHLQAQSAIDAVVEHSGALRGLATALYKIANDLRWMASGPLAGLAEIRLPSVQPGSSIMPAKVNPVILESLLMVCAQVIAHDQLVGFANSQGQFELNTMLPVVARAAIESSELLAAGCANLDARCLAGLEAVAGSAARVAHNPILATALNAEIGYEAAAAIAKEAAASGRSVLEVARERTDLSRERLAVLLDPSVLCGELGRARDADAADRPRPDRPGQT